VGAAQEVALIGMLGYLSYLAGELAGLSGIVTLFCCAVAISHYALHNVSAPARVTLVRPRRRRARAGPPAMLCPCPCKRMVPSVCLLARRRCWATGVAWARHAVPGQEQSAGELQY
jgi:hypothetical protein